MAAYRKDVNMSEIRMDEVRNIGKKGNRFLAVVDENYSARSGEEVVEIKGRYLLIKKPQAFKEYYDLHKKYKDWDLAKHLDAAHELIVSTVQYNKTSDPNRMDHIYTYVRDCIVDPIVILMKKKVNEYNKLQLKNGKQIYDDSMLTKEYFCETHKKLWRHNLFQDRLDNYLDSVSGTGNTGSPLLQKEQFLIWFESEFDEIYDTYAACMQKYGYDIFTIEDCSTAPAHTDNHYVFRKVKDMLKKPLSDQDKLDVYLAMICINPFYQQGWIFLDMSETIGNRNGEVKQLSSYFLPHMSVMWMSLIIRKTDSDYNLHVEWQDAKNSSDRIEKLKKLRDKIYGYMENAGVLSAYRSSLGKSKLLSEIETEIDEVELEVRMKSRIADLEADRKEYEKKLQGYYEEALKTSKYKPKNKYIAMLLLIFTGPLGGHKFYEGRIKWGIIYMFTGGFFIFGLIWDFMVLMAMPKKYVPGQEFGR